MTRPLASALAALALLAGAGAAHPAKADAATLVGVADQEPGAFSDPLYRGLGLKRTRVFVPWNVAFSSEAAGDLDAWLSAVGAVGVEPLVHFSTANGSRCPSRPCKLPSVREYTSAFKAFRKRWPSVRVIGAWNEANHRSQPTFRNPKRAAQYYNAVRKNCGGCTIVAADVIDETNMVSWLRVFRRYATRPRIWGLHNYRDTNPRKGQKYGGTARLLRTVRRGQVWLTETGGIVKFVLPNGTTLFPASESRADLATKRMFTLARRYTRRIKRLYIYNFKAPLPTNRFDSGLVRFDGTPRPAYSTVQKTLATSTFNP
jgi:hypothetical protein